MFESDEATEESVTITIQYEVRKDEVVDIMALFAKYHGEAVRCIPRGCVVTATVDGVRLSVGE